MRIDKYQTFVSSNSVSELIPDKQILMGLCNNPRLIVEHSQDSISNQTTRGASPMTITWSRKDRDITILQSEAHVILFNY